MVKIVKFYVIYSLSQQKNLEEKIVSHRIMNLHYFMVIRKIIQSLLSNFFFFWLPVSSNSTNKGKSAFGLFKSYLLVIEKQDIYIVKKLENLS